MPEGYLSQHLQDCILKLMIWDDDTLKQLRSTIDPKHFTAKETQTICKIIYGYYDSYGNAPHEHFIE